MKHKITAALFFALLFLISLSAQYRGQLISDELLLPLNKDGIQDIYTGFDLPELLFPIVYEEVEIHKIVYWTIAAREDTLIQASGLVTVPVNFECDFPLMNYNHGRLPYDKVLSDLNANGLQHFIGVPFAATGYVSALPDFLGYGETPLSHPHPFTHSKSEASSTVDMLIAAKEFCEDAGILLNEQLFLLGYSNGGHVTMAVHKELETNYTDEFTVTASAPGSGAYDLSGIMKDSMFLSEAFSNPSYIAFSAVSYQFLYENMYDEIGDMFVAPYDSLIPLIYNRYDPQSHLEDSLPLPGYLMIQPDYMDAALADEMHPLNIALRENDIYNWVPQAPMRIYYCEGDEKIPYQNALVAADYMTSNGATDVFAMSAGATYDHNGCGAPSLVAAKLWFDHYREACSPASVADVNSGAVRFYPNPFSEYLYVDGLQGLTQKSIELNIYNLVGQRLWSGRFEQEEDLSLSTTQLIPGSYLFEVKGENFRFGKILLKAE